MLYSYCSKCGLLVSHSTPTCQSCGETLIKPNEIQILKDELHAIKTEYDSKFDSLLNKISKYDLQSIESTKVEKESTLIVNHSDIIENKPENITAIEPIINNNPFEKNIKIASSQKEKIEVQDNIQIPEVKKQKTPGKSITEIIKSIPFLAILLEIISSPFANIWDFINKTYTKYKDKNQLPVFFMTLAGVSALLFGFGYLMQLSIDYFGDLSEIVKITFGFASSFGITTWAIKLYKKEDKYKEFGSALIGLSVALNYLFIYFLSNITESNPIFSSAITGFILIIINTAFAIYFALRYETKIVAILSLLGGAFAPFYLNSENSSPVYFAYLWILSATAIYVAHKIKWKTLGVISFLTSTSIIELAIIDNTDAFSLWIYVVIFHAFAYLFVWFSLFERKKISDSLTKISAVLVAGNISVFLFNLFYLFDTTGFYEILGIIYFANALPFFALFIISRKRISNQVKLLLLVISGTFIAFAIPAIFDQHLSGFFWSVEALALVFLGYTYSIPSVRKEGYILLLVAFSKILFTFEDVWFVNNVHYLFTNGYFNLLALGIILSALIFLFIKFKTDNSEFENKLSLVFSNIGIIWFAAAYITTVAFFTYNWLSFATSILALSIIASAYIFKLTFSRKLGYAIFIMSVIYSSIIAVTDISDLWNNSIFGIGYINLIGIGVYLSALWVLMFKLHSTKPELFKKKGKYYTSYISEFIAIWFTAVFLVTGYYTIGNYTFNLAIIPMFGLIYIGHKNKLIFSEYLGLAYSLIIALGIVASVIEVDSLHFSLQTLYGKIAMTELLLGMWLLKFFYDKLLHGTKKGKTMDITREVFFWIVPLLILSPVKRLFPEYLPLAIWISALITFFIYETTKRKSLIIEFTILSMIGATMSLTPESYTLAIPLSLIVLATVFIKKKGYDKAICYKSEFSHIFILSVYYIGVSIFIISSDVFNSISSGLIASSIYFSTIVIFRNRVTPLKKNYLLAFWISLLLSILSIVGGYFDYETSNQLLSIITLIPIGVLLYGKNTIYEEKKKTWLQLIIILHTLVLINYSIVFDKTWLTIAFIIHAIIILFNSMKLHFKPLIWQSVAFFSLAIIKLVLWDIAHFTMLQKVIVFIIIGGLLIGASFLYVKLKDRFEETN